MHTRMTIYCISQSTKVVSFELSTCINEVFVCHSTLGSGSYFSDELLTGNDVTFETISSDQISTFFTGTLFEIRTRMTSEHTYSYQFILKPRTELRKQTEKSQVFVKTNVQSLISSLILKVSYSQDRIKWRVTKDLPTRPRCLQTPGSKHQERRLFFHLTLGKVQLNLLA
ncbi:contractile injection system protein, VgrG/Pvc8 family [Pseudoalteromonas piscicida]|uniref:contractile injection system protein, VgrG/Pvc8 family n=1 Tax=Pseudoalteromonas piscicida TaxID=43662 RepID=UPI001C93A7C3|nr:phage late control D family protein [Pseudoalteromonas piscicida]